MGNFSQQNPPSPSACPEARAPFGQLQGSISDMSSRSCVSVLLHHLGCVGVYGLYRLELEWRLFISVLFRCIYIVGHSTEMSSFYT
jgi:hypothetical protein